MTILKLTAPEDITSNDIIACGFENHNPQPKDIIDTLSYEEVLRYFGKRFRAMLLDINATIPRFKNAKWLNITNWDWDNPKNITAHSLIDEFDTVVTMLRNERQLGLYDMGKIKVGSLFDSVGMNFFAVQPFSLEDAFKFGIGGESRKSATPVTVGGAYFQMEMPEQYAWGTQTRPFDFSTREFIQMMDILTHHFNSSWGRLNARYPNISIPAVPTHINHSYQVFPHREPAGWFTYVDAYVTKKQIPEAFAIYHLRAGGSLIQATKEYLSIYNEQHIITANKVEIRLNQLGLLPPIAGYAEVPKIALGITDGRVKPSKPQNSITME